MTSHGFLPPSGSIVEYGGSDGAVVGGMQMWLQLARVRVGGGTDLRGSCCTVAYSLRVLLLS